MDRRREIFVNVPAERPQHEQSFEELRIADYIRAYSTTGHPPQPCPREPFDKAQRERLGLPPHMEPHVEVDSIPAPPSECAAAALLILKLDATTPTGPPPTDIAALPEAQTFQRTPEANEGGNKVYLQSIVCQHTFQNFSPEELRVRAYSMGKVYLPSEAIPSVLAPAPAAIAVPAPSNTDHDEAGQLQSMTASALYAKHSFEEHRLAYLRAHSELTSEQIYQTRVIG